MKSLNNLPIDVMMVVVRVGRRRRGHVGLIVQRAVVVAALRRRAQLRAAPAQVGAVGGAPGRRPRGGLEQRLLDVRVGLHVSRVWRVCVRGVRVRRPQLLVAARVGRREAAAAAAGGVAEPQRGRAVRAPRAAALRLALCAYKLDGPLHGGSHWPASARVCRQQTTGIIILIATSSRVRGD